MANETPNINKGRILHTLLGAIGFCTLPMAVALNPIFLQRLWTDDPPLAARPLQVLWAMHVGGILAALILLAARGRLLASPWAQRRQGPLLGASLMLAGIVFALFLFFLFEATFATLNVLGGPPRPPVYGDRDDTLHLPTPGVGHLLAPNHVGHEVLKQSSNGELLYDVTYTTGADGWRVVPGNSGGPYAKHLALFGCSFTFGIGLNDDQTLASQIAQRVPEDHVYNFGVPAFGTANVLRLLETQDLASLVQEDEGMGIYIFMEDHLRRSLGSMRRVFGFANDFPFYTLDTAGHPVFSGIFDKDRVGTNRLYAWLSREQCIQWSGMDVPPRFTESHFRFIVALIEAAREQYLRQFPKGRFVAMLFPPRFPDLDPCRVPMTRILAERAIEHYTFPECHEFCADKMCYYDGDGHPRANLIAYLAGRMVERVVLAPPASPSTAP